MQTNVIMATRLVNEGTRTPLAHGEVCVGVWVGVGGAWASKHKGFLPSSLVFFFQRDSLTCQQRGSCGGCPPNIAPTAPAAVRHISASARTAAPTAVLMARSMAPPITTIVDKVHFHDQHND